MDPRRDPTRPITKRKQLLVEGRTPELFFEALAQHLGIPELEIRSFDSNSRLRPFLKAFCARPEYKEMVEVLGIIRDAEFTPKPGETDTIRENAHAAFQSVCSSLVAADQPVPDGMGVFTPASPRIGIFILPNCEHEGMLETSCLESVTTPEISACIESFFGCMAATPGAGTPRNMTKARTFAFLATKDIYDPLVGRAAQKGVWPWEHAAFEKLRQFLRAL